MRNIIFVSIVTGLASLSLQGCSVSNIHSAKSIETISSAADARAIIQPGMSMAEVESRLGKPTHTYAFNDQITWLYASAQTNFTGKKLLSASLGKAVLPDTKHVSVIFDANGLVERVDYNEQRTS